MIFVFVVNNLYLTRLSIKVDTLIFTTCIGIITISFLGNLFHFIFPLSGKKRIVSLLGSVNESTWEHLKLAFWPFLIFIIIEHFYLGEDYANQLFLRSMGMVTTLILIPVFFYSYKRIIGKRLLIFDIGLFIASIMIGMIFSMYLMENFEWINCDPIGSFILCLVSLLFLLGTNYPPRIFLFRDPVTGKYGLID